MGGPMRLGLIVQALVLRRIVSVAPPANPPDDASQEDSSSAEVPGSHAYTQQHELLDVYAPPRKELKWRGDEDLYTAASGSPAWLGDRPEYYHPLAPFEAPVPLGNQRERADIFRRGEWHRTVHIWLSDGRGKLLLQQRSPQKDIHPFKWDVSCAGHVGAGEDPIGSAQRELHEELGLTVTAEQLRAGWVCTLPSVYMITTKKLGKIVKRTFQEMFVLELPREAIQSTALRLQREEVSATRLEAYETVLAGWQLLEIVHMRSLASGGRITVIAPPELGSPREEYVGRQAPYRFVVERAILELNGRDAFWDDWLVGWHGKMEEWWERLPVAIRPAVQACMGVLSLQMARRLKWIQEAQRIARGLAGNSRAALTDAERTADADPDCEWLVGEESAETDQLGLPEFPDLPKTEDLNEFVLPIPRLLPRWQALPAHSSLVRAARERYASNAAAIRTALEGQTGGGGAKGDRGANGHLWRLVSSEESNHALVAGGAVGVAFGLCASVFLLRGSRSKQRSNGAKISSPRYAFASK